MLWDMFSRGTTTTTTTTTMTATALSARNNTTSADPVTNKLSSRGHNKTYDDFQRVVQEVQAYHPDDDVTHDNEPSMITALLVYANYAMLILFGYIEEWIGKYLLRKKYNVTQEGYAPIVEDFNDFYNRRLYHRIHDCWNRPISSRPGAWIDVMDREWETDPAKWKRVAGSHTLRFTGTSTRCLNLSSYNYLGFADNEESCNAAVIESLKKYGTSMCSGRMELGATATHRELEKLVARYVGKEDALVFGMGFATNSTTIPALVGKGDLLVSDSLNHASIAVGAKQSGAKVVVFKHDDLDHLERVIREAMAKGQQTNPGKYTPWNKIVIVVEGIYSMEGDISRLPEIVAIKKKYKCYLYVDEAHSIGALGHRGQGVCQYWNVDPKDVDVLMGTFTKSFSSVGGYIAGDSGLIRHLRRSSFGSLYANTMSTPCAQQIISAMQIVLGEDGSNIGRKKITALRENSNLFRTRLMELGFKVYGSKDSPVIPIMIYNPGKMAEFSRECLKRNLSVVVVGYPATAITEARARFCISSAHTKEDLEEALRVIDEVGDLILIKYNKKAPSRLRNLSKWF